MLPPLPPSAAQVIYVDASAHGANDGSSWQDAFVDLQSALADSDYAGEVWVARGTYKPTTTRDRDATFVLNGALYGGFAGTETSLDDRAGLFDETILSGDLAGDDGQDFERMSENSRCVVTDPFWPIAPKILDGFTIRGGRNERSSGGGLLMDFLGNDLTVRNCTFERNEAVRGGGICAGEPRLRIERCRFIGNRAREYGGGVAGLTDTEIRSCVFLGNSAGDVGGGVWSGVLAVDCVFSGNSARRAGGGVFGTDRVANCTFASNEALAGGGLFGGSYPWNRGHASNCILWGNSGSSVSMQASQIAGYLEVDDSAVEGWDGRCPGRGSFDADPIFRDPLGPDGIAGTLDDDLSLDRGSPCVDTAPRMDYRGNGTDAQGGPRFIDSLACDGGGILDIGGLERRAVDGSTEFCVSTPSSLGVPAEISGPCVARTSDGTLRISASPLPAGHAVLWIGVEAAPRPYGDGVLCLARTIRSVGPVATSGGSVSFDVDPTAFAPGATIGLQVLFRDAPAARSGFNLSSAMRLVVLP